MPVPGAAAIVAVLLLVGLGGCAVAPAQAVVHVEVVNDSTGAIHVKWQTGDDRHPEVDSGAATIAPNGGWKRQLLGDRDATFTVDLELTDHDRALLTDAGATTGGAWSIGAGSCPAAESWLTFTATDHSYGLDGATIAQLDMGTLSCDGEAFAASAVG